MDLDTDFDLSLEQRIEQRFDRLERRVAELQASVDLAINYLRVVSGAFGFREELKKLDKNFDELQEQRGIEIDAE